MAPVAEIERAERLRVFWALLAKLRGSWRRLEAQVAATQTVAELLAGAMPAGLRPDGFPAWVEQVAGLEAQAQRLGEIVAWFAQLEELAASGAVTFRLSEEYPGDIDIGVDLDRVPAPPVISDELEPLEGLGFHPFWWLLGGIGALTGTKFGCDYLGEREETARAEIDRDVTMRLLGALSSSTLSSEDRAVISNIVREWGAANRAANRAAETTADKVARTAGYVAGGLAVIAAAWLGVTWLKR